MFQVCFDYRRRGSAARYKRRTNYVFEKDKKKGRGMRKLGSYIEDTASVVIIPKYLWLTKKKTKASKT